MPRWASSNTFSRVAPENLAAIRGIAEIHHRRGELGEALGFYKAALALARHDPDLEQTVDEISRALTPERPLVDDGLSFEQASAEFMAALEDLPGGLEAALAPESSARRCTIASTFARLRTDRP